MGVDSYIRSNRKHCKIEKGYHNYNNCYNCISIYLKQGATYGCGYCLDNNVLFPKEWNMYGERTERHICGG